MLEELFIKHLKSLYYVNATKVTEREYMALLNEHSILPHIHNFLVLQGQTDMLIQMTPA